MSCADPCPRLRICQGLKYGAFEVRFGDFLRTRNGMSFLGPISIFPEQFLGIFRWII
ncbi:hypothetical protein K443DRAFT_673069 [Laccaria amethystina LaAM-08-1]|uniref:Uncharacterized protein n=1 Tax=Laccaria amethystina LaAM-08-1 TaxID=1095629 RepID=A0A0C9YBY4_9AGAR|nr:hypothetical protein K443DRAFT_673069 [Laccaria amethystina LaAM-08-1]